MSRLLARCTFELVLKILQSFGKTFSSQGGIASGTIVLAVLLPCRAFSVPQVPLCGVKDCRVAFKVLSVN